MPNHESKTCPRCDASFECKVGSILECKCSSVFLSAAEQDYLAIRYEECLCVNCMMEVQTEFSILNHDKKIQHFLRH